MYVVIFTNSSGPNYFGPYTKVIAQQICEALMFSKGKDCIAEYREMYNLKLPRIS